jgi:hypothetical protein
MSPSIKPPPTAELLSIAAAARAVCSWNHRLLKVALQHIAAVNRYPASFLAISYADLSAIENYPRRIQCVRLY